MKVVVQMHCEIVMGIMMGLEVTWHFHRSRSVPWHDHACKVTFSNEFYPPVKSGESPGLRQLTQREQPAEWLQAHPHQQQAKALPLPGRRRQWWR